MAQSLYKVKKKYTLTLLEVCIAFFLVGILLSSLWGLYHRWLKTYQQNQKTQTQIHQLALFKEKMDQIAMFVGSPPPEEKEKNSLFTLPEKIEEAPALYFSYYQEIDPDPLFLGKVGSLLYMVPSKKLCLATWPIDEQTGVEARIECLLEPASSFSVSFFDPQTNYWRKDWPDHMERLPLWMKLEIKGEEQKEFLFRFERSFDPILYLQKEMAIPSLERP
jgi:type II secretory pathway component PulJ